MLPENYWRRINRGKTTISRKACQVFLTFPADNFPENNSVNFILRIELNLILIRNAYATLLSLNKFLGKEILFATPVSRLQDGKYVGW
jgi:hypothetical protein